MWPNCPTLWCNESWWKTHSFLLSFNLNKTDIRVSMCWMFTFWHFNSFQLKIVVCKPDFRRCILTVFYTSLMLNLTLYCNYHAELVSFYTELYLHEILMIPKWVSTIKCMQTDVKREFYTHTLFNYFALYKVFLECFPDRENWACAYFRANYFFLKSKQKCMPCDC